MIKALEINQTEVMDSIQNISRDSAELILRDSLLINQNIITDALTIDRIIALLASLSALITAIFVYRSLREMKMQRISTYKPEIVFSSKYYLCKIFENFNIHYGHIDKLSDMDYLSESFTLDINMYNLGFGSAKKIKLRWKIEMSEIVAKFDEFQSNNCEIEVNENDSGFILKVNNVQFNYSKAFSSDKDYILPVNIEKIPVTVILPPFYSYLIGVYTKLYSKSKKEQFAFCKVKLICDYNDIDGNVYSKKYEVFPRLMYLSVEKNGDCKVKYDFVINEI